jgi:eukaryotic-like serine/threonine-protein kinase
MAAQNNVALPDGLELAGYRIVKKIASGGFSIVYLAYDALGNAVAIKEYLPSVLALRQEGELVPAIAPANLPLFRLGLKCFFEEGRALAKIAHPNVVRVLNFFRANNTVYLVMAYESGHTLQDQITRQCANGGKSGGQIGEAFIRRVFIGVLNGLREVHANGLLHLDLKPANIYLRGDGTPLLLDFGAARHAVDSGALTVAPMVTPGFAAPELTVKTSPLGPWTDVYGIGAAIYTCMAGVPPQPAEERRQGDRMEAHLATLAGHYSADLVQLVRRALAIEPAARPQGLAELQEALQARPAPPAPAGAFARLRMLARRLRPGRRGGPPGPVRD